MCELREILDIQRSLIIIDCKNDENDYACWREEVARSAQV